MNRPPHGLNQERQTRPNLSIDELRTRWPDLEQLSRAEALADLVHRSQSIRGLAGAIGQPESSIRYLLHLADATPAEKDWLRDGTVSSNEIFRLVRERRARKEKENQGPTAHPLATVVGEHEPSADMILSWLKSTRVISGDASSILQNARTTLRDQSTDSGEKLRRRFPASELGHAASLVELGSMTSDPVQMVHLRSIWLCQWLVKRYAFPADWMACLALAQQAFTPSRATARLRQG